ncbi:MAG: DUF4394 domain-containing protein [Alphaproteobacteria bacterium]|nr:MAG: DUF4394 domain-containing protein [Alphaproteobacteria bacterium]
MRSQPFQSSRSFPPSRRHLHLAATGLVTLLTVSLSASLARTAHAELIYGVTETDITGTTTPFLVSFDSATPKKLTTIGAITGLVRGQMLRSIDFRPSNGQLYALSNSGNGTAAQLYTVNLKSGTLTKVGKGLTLTGNRSDRISIDFDPASGALRVLTGTATNYRVNASTSALIAQDRSINPGSFYADIAYSNNVVGARQTTLYAYDVFQNSLGRIGGLGGWPSPDRGQYTSIGTSEFSATTPAISFDISGATGTGYLSLNEISSPDDNSEFYIVNLRTGALTLVGNSPTALLDFSVIIPSTTQKSPPKQGTVPQLSSVSEGQESTSRTASMGK